MKIINPTTLEGVRQFYTELFNWVGHTDYLSGLYVGILNKEIRYFPTQESLTELMIKNKGFGCYQFNEERFENDDKKDAVKQRAKHLNTWATDKECVHWTGAGFYVTWDWDDNGERVKRIDDAYSEIMTECQNVKDFYNEQMRLSIDAGESTEDDYEEEIEEYVPTEKEVDQLMENVIEDK